MRNIIVFGLSLYLYILFFVVYIYIDLNIYKQTLVHTRTECSNYYWRKLDTNNTHFYFQQCYDM